MAVGIRPLQFQAWNMPTASATHMIGTCEKCLSTTNSGYGESAAFIGFRDSPQEYS